MSPQTVEAALYDSKNVAIFKVESVEKFVEGEKGYGYGGYKKASLSVEKVFQGNLKVGQKFDFRQGGGGDCILTYSEKLVGIELLLFLGEKPKKNEMWEVYICSRSNSVKGASADLLYLEKMAKMQGKTRLSGILSQEIEANVEGILPIYNRLAGRKVNVSGNGKNIELKTDKNGVYEIYDLPPGNYKVTPEKINGFKLSNENENSVEVEIEEESHTEEDFDFIIDNFVSGKVLDTNGIALKDVCLDLLPVNGKPAEDFSQSDCTDKNGVFKFEEIPPGTYVMIINDDGEITADEPFGTFYYPNTTKREEAAEMTIVAGSYFNNLTITAQKIAETVTVSGTLMFEDGKPIENKSVYFSSDGKVASSDETDSKGHFSLKVLKGKKGKLSASMWSYIGEFENCPELEKIIRATGEKVPLIETQSVEIEANTDLSGIELKFPFPNCKKSEK